MVCSPEQEKVGTGSIEAIIYPVYSDLRIRATVSVLAMNYQDRISIEPGKRGGKPCIRGMRITVYDVLEYLASGVSEQEIIDDFPDLTQEDIRACLAFAADRERKLVSGIDP
jgi:uncharacterized protein (DUF433 family)